MAFGRINGEPMLSTTFFFDDDEQISPGAPPAPVTTVVGRLFLFFFIFDFSLHSLLNGGTWFQTVELGSVLECDKKMRFIVPKNHPERKRTSILVYQSRKNLKLVDFLSQSFLFRSG